MELANVSTKALLSELVKREGAIYLYQELVHIVMIHDNAVNIGNALQDYVQGKHEKAAV